MSDSERTSIERSDVMRRHAEVIRLYIRGHSQRDIAATLGIDQSTVSRHISTAHSEWRDECREAVEEMRTLSARRILAVAIEAWNAWDRSQRSANAVKVKKESGGSGGDKESTEKQVRERDGERGYLETIRACEKDLRDLYGLDAPKRTEITGADGGPVTLFGVLTQLQSRPPRPPEQLEERPANVIDVESIERLIADPNFRPEARETETEAADGENLECDV